MGETSTNHGLTEKVVKVFKTHRSVQDIDCAFVKEVVQGMVKSEVFEVEEYLLGCLAKSLAFADFVWAILRMVIWFGVQRR